jgi:hypothetical protein
MKSILVILIYVFKNAQKRLYSDNNFCEQKIAHLLTSHWIQAMKKICVIFTSFFESDCSKSALKMTRRISSYVRTDKILALKFHST